MKLIKRNGESVKKKTISSKNRIYRNWEFLSKYISKRKSSLLNSRRCVGSSEVLSGSVGGL